jgi:nitronate monooxygenase
MTWAETRVASRLGIAYPIVQGALGGFASQRLTAAVSSYGGLGSFGGHALSPAAIAETIAELRSLTDAPFAINLWVSMEDDGAAGSDAPAFERSLAAIAPHLRSLGAEPPAFSAYTPRSFVAQARALIDAKAPVFSFTFGIPPQEILDECRTHGIVTIGTATTVEEALELERADVDLIVATGFEAGGHRGSFLRAPEDSLIGTFSLVPQVVDAVSIPVIAAGGVADARGVAAAFALGAEGAQLGTAFLACEESGASPLQRQMLLGDQAHRTALTRGFTGRLGRGVENLVFETLSDPAAERLPYPLQRYLVRNLAAPAEAQGHPELVPMWAGQSARLIRHTSARDLLDSVVSGVAQLVPER